MKLCCLLVLISLSACSTRPQLELSESQSTPTIIAIRRVAAPAPQPAIVSLRAHGTAVGNASSVPDLIKQLGHADDVVRTHAATDLGLAGSAARPAVPALVTAVRTDPSKWVRRAAVKALAKIGGPAATDCLRIALNDSNKWVRHSAERALARVN